MFNSFLRYTITYTGWYYSFLGSKSSDFFLFAFSFFYPEYVGDIGGVKNFP